MATAAKVQPSPNDTDYAKQPWCQTVQGWKSLHKEQFHSAPPITRCLVDEAFANT
jgi:hypothetical protein